MKEFCGLEPHDVVHVMMVKHYLDVLKEFAHTMVVPYEPSAVADIENQIRNSFTQASIVQPATSNPMG